MGTANSYEWWLAQMNNDEQLVATALDILEDRNRGR